MRGILSLGALVLLIGVGETKKTSTRPDGFDDEQNDPLDYARFQREIATLKEENGRILKKLEEMARGQLRCQSQGAVLEELIVKLSSATLFDVAERGVLPAVRFYVSEDPRNVNRTNPSFHHCTVVHHACKGGHLATVRFLIEEAGAPVEALNSYASTPLIYAAKYGHPEIIEYLISKGAQVNYENQAKNTALYYAVENNQLACVKRLVARGANGQRKNASNKSPFDLAKENKRLAHISNYLASVKN